jgi:hypothetical protein
MIVRILSVAVASLSITACSSLPDTVTGSAKPGYRHYDPCIRCGESWVSVPNQEMAALKESKERNPIYRLNMERMYGPDWATKFPKVAEKLKD